MIIRNSTIYNPEEVEKLVNFAMAGIYTDKVLVKVRNSKKAYHGVAHQYGKITVNIGPPECFPCTNMCSKIVKKKLNNETVYVKGEKVTSGWVQTTVMQPYGGPNSPFIQYNTWQEALVGVAAHEARHIYQFQNKLFTNDDVGAEEDAEKYALLRLNRFRALGNKINL